MPVLGIIASSKLVVPPPAFESIATATPSGNSTFTFSSIPGTYQHLQIRALVKHSSNIEGSRDLWLRFNSDTGSNYASHLLSGLGGTPFTDAQTDFSRITIRRLANYSFTGTDNMFGAGIIDIHDYASTTKNKTIRSFSGTNVNTTSASYGVTIQSGLWMSTSAITSITMLFDSGTYASNTTFALYGVKGA